jgi:methyltransferase
VTGVVAFTVLVAVIGVQRIAELTVSKRNVRWSQQGGGIEYNSGHYPFMVVLHTGLLAGALLEVHLGHRQILPWLAWPMFGLVLVAQGVRWWCMRTLGPLWNTRIIVIPGLPRVVTGPYRWLRHPNYLAVAVEGFALPLVGSAWMTASVFTALNLPLLAVRIRAEEAALATLPAGNL